MKSNPAYGYWRRDEIENDEGKPPKKPAMGAKVKHLPSDEHFVPRPSANAMAVVDEILASNP